MKLSPGLYNIEIHLFRQDNQETQTQLLQKIQTFRDAQERYSDRCKPQKIITGVSYLLLYHGADECFILIG